MFDFRAIWDEELSKERYPAATGSTGARRAVVAAMQRAFDLGRQDYVQELERGLREAMSAHEAGSTERRASEASYNETLATP